MSLLLQVLGWSGVFTVSLLERRPSSSPDSSSSSSSSSVLAAFFYRPEYRHGYFLYELPSMTLTHHGTVKQHPEQTPIYTSIRNTKHDTQTLWYCKTIPRTDTNIHKATKHNMHSPALNDIRERRYTIHEYSRYTSVQGRYDTGKIQPFFSPIHFLSPPSPFLAIIQTNYNHPAPFRAKPKI